jgi:hypothetical protein
MRGYLGDAEATASVLRDGWLDLQREAALDDNGFLRLHP